MGSQQLEPTQQGTVVLDGHDIHWERFGTGEREAVCLLNGLAMHTKAWYGFVPMLHPELDVVLYDYLGQGDSAKPDEPVSIAGLADALELVRGEVGIDRLHVMGISYGGFVALEYARQYHPRLHTLTLSGILLFPEELFEMYEAMSMQFYRRGPEVFGLYTSYLYEKIFGEAFIRRVTREGLEPMRARFEERFRDQIHSLIRLTEAQDPHFAAVAERLPEYRAVAAPTLVMPGDQDRAIPLWQQRKLLDVFPNSRWLPIPECGHVAYIEQPQRFFGNLLAFMRAKSTGFTAA
ncbi:MAG: alpha/beta hydrolase [Thermoanaerobaculaceae bacterium]|nr:alpha/beta hydrolase [Thermoanaerobaculaceae bacterium]